MKFPPKAWINWPGVYEVKHKHPGIIHPWRLNCCAPLCNYVGFYQTEVKALEAQSSHPCPTLGSGTTTFSWGVMSDNYLAPLWARLDANVDAFMSDEALVGDKEIWKAAARETAECLAILMPPFFTTGDEVVREAMKRWKARRAGETYETPGLGRLKFSPPPEAITMSTGYVYTGEYDPKVGPEVKHNLSDDQVAKIKMALAAGFPAEALAEAYGVGKRIIQSLAD